ncbi:HelD family protein [Actinopolymorpha alba]|uniref:HelD family protein n=1 Tax=Actinopolymorpha alba TaxID=533267 RepID=UPI000368C706|nr:AAA family ATPase [Actinopolymorpha alba]
MPSAQSNTAADPPDEAPIDTGADPEVAAERAHLEAAHAALKQMHAEVIETETPAIVNSGTDSYWDNKFYQWSREHRAEVLLDQPKIPLFFGRLDCEPGAVFDRVERGSGPGGEVDRIYIGRRHIREPDGTPLVIDWRAPVSVPFYRAGPADPQRVLVRRRHGFSHEPGPSGYVDVTAYEDEPVSGVPDAAEGFSSLVTAEIERPRSGPMRDIVATIQPDQDVLVRAPLDTTICVQGAPGTGKTAVGLHRVAYLLYVERTRLARDGGIAIIGPNRSFLQYIRHVLPALGEVFVRQLTFPDLIRRYFPDHAMAADEEPTTTVTVKGDARMAEVLRRALWSGARVSDDLEALVYSKGASRFRVPDYEVREIVAGVLETATRYAAGRATLAQRLAHAVLIRMEQRGGTPDDRTQNAVARSAPVKRILDRVWPRRTPEQVLYRLLSDADFLAETAGDELTPEEQKALLWPKPYRSVKSARWSEADLVLLDEVQDLLERAPRRGHLVVDEAQDLSAMQLRALGRRCRTATVLGDLAQATTPYASTSWQAVLDQLGASESAELVELTRGFRVPAAIIEYAARLLPVLQPDLAEPVSLRRAEGALEVTAIDGHEVAAEDILQACLRIDEQGGHVGSIGIIAADAEIERVFDKLAAEPIRSRLDRIGLVPGMLGRTENSLEHFRLVCVPASLAKGLEFDGVVAVEPARIVDAEPRGLNRLYVVLTRAVSALTVLHARPLPTELVGARSY